MRFDQAFRDHDATEIPAGDLEAAAKTAAATAQIVESLRDLSRAAREHFRTDDRPMR